jgi:hypothetical protein
MKEPEQLKPERRDKDRNNCLVYAISPTHIVSAICAILTRHAPEDVNVIILVQWPGALSEVTNELTAIMKSMVRPFSFVAQLKLFPYGVFTEMLAADDLASFKLSLRKWIGVDHADEIYYPHDVVGQLYQGLSTVYGDARRICFGDGMGTVCERQDLLSYHVRSKIESPNTTETPSVARRICGWLSRAKRKAMSSHSKPDSSPKDGMVLKDFLPDEAVLILPIDLSGNFLKQFPLAVCSRSVVLDVMEKCADSCEELQSYICGLLKDFQGRRKYILLTETLPEGSLIDFRREVEMYCHMVADHCEPGSVVLIKSHPGVTKPLNEQIAEQLAGKYEVVVMEKKFRRYPIELWKGLVLESTTISMGYPVLSLKYLYGVDVIQPLNNEFIEHWFSPWSWRLFKKNSLSVYMESLERLPGWDGKSVLWAGHTQGA